MFVFVFYCDSFLLYLSSPFVCLCTQVVVSAGAAPAAAGGGGGWRGLATHITHVISFNGISPGSARTWGAFQPVVCMV